MSGGIQCRSCMYHYCIMLCIDTVREKLCRDVGQFCWTYIDTPGIHRPPPKRGGRAGTLTSSALRLPPPPSFRARFPLNSVPHRRHSFSFARYFRFTYFFPFPCCSLSLPLQIFCTRLYSASVRVCACFASYHSLPSHPHRQFCRPGIRLLFSRSKKKESQLFSILISVLSAAPTSLHTGPPSPACLKRPPPPPCQRLSLFLERGHFP